MGSGAVLSRSPRLVRTMADENSDAGERVRQHVRKVLARLKEVRTGPDSAGSGAAAELGRDQDGTRGVGGTRVDPE